MTSSKTFWVIVISAAAIMMVTMGIRQSMGLFVSPLNTATGLGIVSISFAMAVGQFSWGLAQPLFGILADRIGSFKTIAVGTVMMALGLAFTPYMQSDMGLTVALGVMMAAGAGAGSFSILIGAAAQRISAEKRSMAAGIINAGGSFGQFVFAPITQTLIHSLNWIGALLTLAATSLSAILLALPLRDKKSPVQLPAVSQAEGITLWQQVIFALQDRSYWYIHAGFFTCGFHIAFLVTHLPGEVNLCGLSASVGATSLAIIGLTNVIGSLYAGWLGQHHLMKMILFWMYASRALIVAIYLMAPKNEWTFYVFAGALGFTWLSTVPPTAGLVGKLFGTRYLATLFGLTLFSHQVGGFLGAWLGGISLYARGNYEWMWYADIALALIAGILNLPIRERRW